MADLRKLYPGAHVHASTFDAFFKEANKPENKEKLPVVTAGECGGDAVISLSLAATASISTSAYYLCTIVN